MVDFHNIEQSAFHKGQYVGYCNGAWKIRKMESGVWLAVHLNSGKFKSATTLRELSEYFELHNGKKTR